MDIIIPLGGKGERFLKQGYSVPKPLIPAGYKEMIRHVIDRLTLCEHDTISILYHEVLDQHNFSGFIRRHYPHIHLVPIPFQTRGAVETIDYGLRHQQDYVDRNEDQRRRCLLLDCDAFYTQDIIGIARQYENGVFVFREEDISQPAKFSYVSVNDLGHVANIAEKSRISSFANTGAYLFKDRETLLTYTHKVLEQDFRFCNEFYTSCVIKCMLMDHHIFKVIELPKSSYISLGTPEQVNDYLHRTHAFLFDLDGTLVDTTDIYVRVWRTLLEPYHANVNHSFFKTYIDGNNDEMVIRLLIPRLNKEERRELSHRKDALFLEFMDQLKIIGGAVEFIHKVRLDGHWVGIVTNCNRLVAETILRHCGLEDLVDVLIVGNECDRPKPHPDPYQKAKNILMCDKVVIFEDSSAGFLSARGVSPRCLVGINSHNRPEHELKELGAHIVIDNFSSLSVSDVAGHQTDNQIILLEKKIHDSISEKFPDLEKVVVLTNKLKGGYIADVMRVDLVMKNGNTIQCVAKLQSENVNNLSDMAIELGLYQREHYFYEAIRDHVRIKAPHFYGTIRNEHMKPCGILLEYLPPSKFQLGLDLEKEPLDLTLGLVRKIASHHARFWGKDLIQSFPQLTKNNDPTFFPRWGEYVRNKWPLFKERWGTILTSHQLEKGGSIIQSFDNIQQHLSNDPLTLCHGDVKSPNIFFRQREPYFIDWQYIVAGKGVQDLVFLMIESFSIPHISTIGNTLKEYYYIALLEEGVANYSREDYENDFQASLCYFPFFVAMWFGTTPSSQLIDPNFPFFFIQKLFSFMDKYLDTTFLLKL